MSVGLEVETMAKRETMPVRLGVGGDAGGEDRGLVNGETLTVYATRVLLAAANRDIDEFARARVQGPARRPKGGK